jgi:chromosome segregation ATPase
MSKTSTPVISITPFEHIDSFSFDGFSDPSVESRKSIVSMTHDIFGNNAGDAEILGRLIEAALSIRDSKQKILQELRVVGGNLSGIFHYVLNMQIKQAGEDTASIQKTAASMAWKFIRETVSISPPQARSIIRCYEKFADNERAVRAFSISDLSLLNSPTITEEHVESLIAKKLANPGMTRAELKNEISALVKRQEEKLVDAVERATRLDSELDESAAELDLAERANRRLREELAEVVKDHAEKEKALRDLHSDMSLRTNHYATVQKKLADAEAECTRLTDELANASKAKPVTEVKTVEVETLPESYAKLEDALTDALSKLTATRDEQTRIEAEIAELKVDAERQRAEIEAGSAAKRMLEEVIQAWEPFAAKYSTAQLAVQAGNNTELYMPTLRALSCMLAKFLSEIDAVVMRKAA